MSSGHFLQSIIDRPRRERLHEYRKLGPASGRRSDGACPRKGRSLISVATEKVCTIQIKSEDLASEATEVEPRTQEHHVHQRQGMDLGNPLGGKNFKNVLHHQRRRSE